MSRYGFGKRVCKSEIFNERYRQTSQRSFGRGGGYEVEAFLFARMNEVTTAFRLKDGCELPRPVRWLSFTSHNGLSAEEWLRVLGKAGLTDKIESQQPLG